MKPTDHLLKTLVYLDRGFIADLYEVVTGESPSTLITKNEGKKAGAQIPVFSAEISAQETRSFPVSTLTMLANALPALEKEPLLDPAKFQEGMTSLHGWVEGHLTAFRARTSRQQSEGDDVPLATDKFFQLVGRPALDLALITTPEYFSVGLQTFLRMQDTMLKDLFVPVRAYVRVLAAQSHTDQWVGVPLLILERDESR